MRNKYKKVLLGLHFRGFGILIKHPETDKLMTLNKKVWLCGQTFLFLIIYSSFLIIQPPVSLPSSHPATEYVPGTVLLTTL